MASWANVTPFRLETLTGVVTWYDKPAFRGREIFSQEKPIVGKDAVWDVIEKPRQVGVFNVFGAPSLPATKNARRRFSAECLYFSEHILFDANDMFSRAPGTINEPWIARKVGEDIDVPREHCDYLQEWSMWQILTTHALSYAGGDAGSPIISITGTQLGIPAAQSAVAPAVLWSNPATATPQLDLSTWKQTIETQSSRLASKAWMNQNTMDLLVEIVHQQGDKFSNEIHRQVEENQAVTRLGQVELEIYNSAYDASGTMTKFIPDNCVVMVADSGAVQWIEGSQMVPAKPDAQELEDLMEARGRVSWSVLERDPVSVKIIVSDIWFPAVVDGNDLLYATVA